MLCLFADTAAEAGAVPAARMSFTKASIISLAAETSAHSSSAKSARSFVYSSAFSYCDLCFTVIPLRLGAGLVCVLLAAAGARAEAMVKVGRTSLVRKLDQPRSVDPAGCFRAGRLLRVGRAPQFKRGGPLGSLALGYAHGARAGAGHLAV